jgi:DNA-binding SARP family transcriptional activator/tetratricopeptide (TPR) repeat protein
MAQEVSRRLQLLGPLCLDRIPDTNKNIAEVGEEEPIGGVVPRFRSRRTIGLLGYLVAEQRSITRELLAALFWPDEEISKGRGNLRRELHNLAQILPDCWELNRQSVTFAPSASMSIDIYTVLQLEAEERWEEAAELLSGEFLEGLHLNEVLEFENWLLYERERWRELSQTILTQVIEGNIRRGHYADALRHTQRQLQLAPWNENAHMHAMRLLAWMGQRGAALRQFETCKQAVREELEVEPAPETIALYQQIQNGELKIPPQPPAFLTQEKARRKYTHPRFVGREGELAKLEKFFDGVLNGKSQLVFISGGPGRGKTALLEAFSQQMMEMHPNLLVARGNCNAFSGVGDPYLPYRDVMAMLTGDVEARWDAGAITGDHARRLWNAFPMVLPVLLDYGPHLLDVFVPGAPLLSRSIATGSDHAPWLPGLRELVKLERTGTKEVEQSHLFQQVTDMLLHVAKNQPLMLILDDLQWADTASISLLFHLGRRLTDMESRLLIACTYRPEEISIGRPSTSSGKPMRHPLAQVLSEFKRTYGDIWVDLGRYDQVKDRRLLDALVDIEPNRLEEGFRTAIFERTGGHPLFTIELLRAMQDRGELVKDRAGVWIAGPTLDWEVLPARVEAVIGERIDRLDPELQEILTIASVEGDVFTTRVIAEVQNLPERKLLSRLSQDLERRHRLVVEQEEVDTGQRRISRFRFNHILFQDYLYKRLGHEERRLLHGLVAGALENIYQGQLDEIAVQLANHYYQAEDHESSFRFFTMAGERAARFYESGEAVKHYTFAIDLAGMVSPDPISLAKLHRGRGLAYDRLGEFEKGSTDHTTTMHIASDAGNQEVEWRAYLDLGKLWASRDYNRARDYFESSLKLAHRMDEPAFLAVSLNWMGNWHANNANPKKAVEHHQEALNIFELLGDRRDLANTLDLLALASMLGSDLPTSVEYYNRAIPLFQHMQNRPRLASSLIGRANTVVSQVWLASVASIPSPDAICDVSEGLRITREIDSASDETWGFYSLGLLHLIQGQFGRALENMSKGLSIATGIGHREYEVGNRFALGILYSTLFSTDPAREQLERGLVLAQELGSPTWIHIVRGALAAVFSMLNDRESAKSCLGAVISPGAPMDTLGRRYCWVRWAELALLRGDPTLALDITEKLIASAPGISPGRVVTFLWKLKGEALAAIGRTEEARSFFQAAIENAQATGEQFLLWRIHTSLVNLYCSMGQQQAAKKELWVARTLIDELTATIPDETLKDKFRQGACSTLNLDSAL